MGRILDRALEQAGLSDLAERALQGRGLTDAELCRLRAADVLLLAGLADAVRERFHGDDVRLMGTAAAQHDPELLRLAFEDRGEGARTGQELLSEVALARLATPGQRSIGVRVDELGLQLAQVALTFGADVLLCELGGDRILPLLDGPQARRAELALLIERAGRRVPPDGPRPAPPAVPAVGRSVSSPLPSRS
jgi:2-iminoacetate synthase ThiH